MADLFIRWSASNPADLGVRPISPCWPPNAVWTNVSIWMTYPPSHPDPAKRNTTALEARIGEQVIINVAASTTGATFPFPSDQDYVRCQIWVCTGANGVGPVSALASAGGAPGMTALVLGTIDTPNISGVAGALWTPAATDNLAFDAAGAAHVCLAANLVYPKPGNATPPGQGQYLPQFMAAGQPVQTIFPCGDGPVDPRSAVPIGHFHGQRNIQVLDAGRTAMMKVWGKGKKHVVRLVERTEKGMLDAALREHLLAHPRVGLIGGRPRKQRTLRLTPAMRELLDPPLRDALRDSALLALEPRERGLIAGGGRLVLAADENVRLAAARTPLDGIAIEADHAVGRSVEIVAGAGDPKTLRVDLRAAEADEPGVYRVFDMVERDEKERLVGGTTFITLG